MYDPENMCTLLKPFLTAAHLSITPPESPDLPLLGASESSSSKNITQGEALRAL